MIISKSLPLETLFLGIVWSHCALAQAPEIASGGVVNAASWSSPVAPGAMISIFGTNLAAREQSATAPLPYTLGGTSVTINGVSSPLSFVSPTQINAQVPSSLQAANGNIAAASVVVTNASGSSAPVQAGLAAGDPGIFSSDGSGCGAAAALNVDPDGTVSLNSSSNSAAPGDYVTLFGTGFGLVSQQPPDGALATNPSALQTAPGFFIDGRQLTALQYAGVAPGTVGVDQLNFQIPASTRDGCAVPVSASETLGSPSVTLSVQSGRGQCTDPPIESWGELTLSKAVLSGPGNPLPATESLTASFPSAPGLQPPVPEIVMAPDYVANVVPTGAIAILSAVPIAIRACPVPGYSNLSAGAIQVQAPSGATVTAQPLPLSAGGVTYSQSLPTGFIGPGAYAISGAQASPVDLTANLVVGSPIQLQTAFPPGSVISSSQPLNVKWTGGDPGTLVKVTLTSGSGLAARSDYTYADATGESLSISPLCSGNPVSAGGNGVVCSFGLPLSPNAQITVQVLPAPDHVTTITAPGVTGPVRLSWQYSYTFTGLQLAP